MSYNNSSVTTEKGTIMDLLRRDMQKQNENKYPIDEDSNLSSTDDDLLIENPTPDNRIYTYTNEEDLIELSDDEDLEKKKELEVLKKKERGNYDLNSKRKRVLDIQKRIQKKQKDVPDDIKVLKNGRWLQISTGKIVKPEDFEDSKSDLEILDENLNTQQLNTSKFFVQLSEEEQKSKVRNRLNKMNQTHRQKQVRNFIEENDNENNDVSVLSRRATNSILLDEESGIREDNNGNLFIDDDTDLEITDEVHGLGRSNERRRQSNMDHNAIRNLGNEISNAGIRRALGEPIKPYTEAFSYQAIDERRKQLQRAELKNTLQALNKFPSHVQSLFAYAKSLGDFEEKIKKILPKEFVENEEKMRYIKRLYFKFNEYKGLLRFDQYLEDAQQLRVAPLQQGGTRLTRSRTTRVNYFDLLNTLGVDDQVGTLESINERIEAMEDIESNRRSKYMTNARKGILSEHEAEMKRLAIDICSDFTDTVPTKIGTLHAHKNVKKINICMLCATPLREGIPDSFKGCRAKDQSFEYLVKKHGVPCPYVALTAPTETDRRYSKRLFISTKCGHVYCGRCVMRISNSMKLPETLRRRRQNAVGCANPYIYGPAECVDPDCHTRFNEKNVFREVFL
ncbi:uncharacterized protein HGUI_02497 [Hanseniaspora guilliermondii]|uniref:E3 ubiquitin-protein ligase complex SLX5-SLX8 subunit SLX5 n=1 Tax=Hanseniaspora guilliermondii TaxID=56406 RepID=A0A1L0CP99_9ASCO|nr:uncharacterized protein HGUI_02497 [Hanseniaspora guilliermondii]